MESINIFRMKVFPLCVSISIIAVLFFTGIIFFEKGASINWFAYNVALFSIPIFSLLWSFFMVLVFKIKFTSEEIIGFNFWGRHRVLKWGNISKVKSINFLGLKYLKVFSKESGLPLWVPLFIKDIENFSKQARVLPPEGNAFREYFSK